MADTTAWGIGAIVVIVLVTAFALNGLPSLPDQNLQGQATNPAGLADSASADTCEPDRFCDGSKLVIVREDCSIANAFCNNGCNKQAKVCN